jgi:transcriptional regulator with XRE-family HTH domain
MIKNLHPVRRFRLLLDMDQHTLGAAAGKSSSWISALERGRAQADAATLVKLAEALGVELEDLQPHLVSESHD